MDNIPIFCLHHTPLVERKEYLTQIFQRLEISTSVNWITGFNPEDINIPENSNFKNLNEVSLYYKHLFCLLYQLQHKIPYVMILEDDVLLPDNFIDYTYQCLSEFTEIGGDIMFLGIGCGIEPRNITADKHVYYEPDYRSRCAHCYITTFNFARQSINDLLNVSHAYDFKLNDIIEKYSLKSCYTHPGIHQGTQNGIYPSSLNNNF